MLTDPNSLYRKLYNRSLDFFLWVIDQEAPPYKFKLHIQAQTANELKVHQVKRSIEFLVPIDSCEPRIEVRFFSQKRQFKAFVEIDQAEAAKDFFSSTYRARQLTILDSDFNEMFSREMRSYLVKTEEEYTKLAMERYKQEMSKPKAAKHSEEKKRTKGKPSTANRSEAVPAGNSKKLKFDMLSIPTQISTLQQRSDRGTSSIDSGFLASAGSSSDLGAKGSSISSEVHNITLLSHTNSTPATSSMPAGIQIEPRKPRVPYKTTNEEAKAKGGPSGKVGARNPAKKVFAENSFKESPIFVEDMDAESPVSNDQDDETRANAAQTGAGVDASGYDNKLRLNDA